jgi:DNA-directed RNA polymerase specialized sigma24 family protein
VNVIAERWGESAKAVESLLTRARQAFREAYERPE